MPKKRSTNTAIARRITALEAKIDTLAKQYAPKAPVGGFQRAANAIENFGLTRILAAAGAWLVFVTVISFWFDYAARIEERTARLEEAEFRKLAQVATSWELLLTRAGGDIGKGNAINMIIAAQGQMQGADLSCKNAGVARDGICVSAPQYNEIVLDDNDFWAKDIDRTECSMFGGCETRSYVANTNFQNAKLRDLTAEKLLLDQNFNHVVGTGWRVRNAEYASVVLGDAQKTVFDRSPEFTCDDCWFFDSTLSWQSVKSFSNPTLESTVVEMSQRWTEAEYDYWGFTTVIDFPVVFLNRKILQAHEDAYDTWLISDASKIYNPVDFVEWRMYENGTFCVGQDDFKILWPHIKALDALFEKEASSINSLRQLKAHIEGNKTLLELSPNDVPWVWLETPTLQQRLRDDFYTDIAALQFRDTRFPPTQSTRRAYSCDLDFEEVEPLVRERVAAQLSEWEIED